MELNFKGRPDGLGNRIGELIMLTTHSFKNNIMFNYYWNNNNNRNDRKYPILLKCKNINITNTIINSRPNINISNNLNEKLECSKNIKPLFNIYFKNNIKPIGIHIRVGDKINEVKEAGGMTIEYSKNILNKCIMYLNKLKPQYIFVCSDNNGAINFLKNKINKDINIIEPFSDINNSEYTDFFALTLCSEIIMCSKFSSYAITASLISNCNIITMEKQNNMVADAQPGSWLESSFIHIDELL
tara:strand:- start:1021 stop:1749 length:729 start_codon:yes stop_codon:yes gene_type:complete